MSKNLLLAVLCSAWSILPVFGQTEVKALPELDALLEPIRAKYDLPALTAAVFDKKGRIFVGATGIRKKGEPEPVTPEDQWHLGSDTKSMTATLLGTFVAEKKISYNDKVSKFFPRLEKSIDPAFEKITIADLLAHRAGLKPNFNWSGFDDRDIHERREKAAKEMLTTPPEFKVGEYHYSNAGYVLAGTIAEIVGKKSWEKLMEERLFKPLDMKSAGFGGVGTTGKVDQPWGHGKDGTPSGNNGPEADNPAMMGPAGTAHASMADWSKYLVDQLRGANRDKALLPFKIYDEIQSPYPKDTGYGYGWGIGSDGRVKGKIITHNGSNTMNYATAWIPVEEGFGIAVATNRADDEVGKAVDDTIAALLEWRQKNR